MRILLINPPWIIREGNIWNEVASIMPPLGLAWLATALERSGHDVSILDAHAERMDYDAILSYIQKGKGFELIGITATTSLIHYALKIAGGIRKNFPRTLIVLGGVHPTVLPEEVLSEPSVDIVVRGEGEGTIVDLAGKKPLKDILGISYRVEGKLIHNPDRPLIKDLDSIGMPAYHLLPMNKYYPATGAYKRLPAVSMLATRGCPGRCTFCYRIFGDRLRVRSGRKLAEEAKYLQDNYGIKEICFYDDTFTAVKKEIYAFCQGLKDLKVDLTWSCFSRLDAISEDLLRTMKEVGLHQIMYGIESANKTILQNINKRTDIEQAERVVAMTKRAGIDVRAAFMLGNPGETKGTMAETLRFAMKLNPEIAVFNVTTPFPGTDIFKWAEENGYLLTKDWTHYDMAHTVMELPTISSADVQKFYSSVYRRFYLRPRYILMRLGKIRDKESLMEAVRGFRAILHNG